LLPSQAVATQSLRVQYHYFAGRINWRPIVISALILLVTNFAGVLMFSLEINRRVRRRRRIRRRFAAAAVSVNGGVPSRDDLISQIPAGTRYDEVVARFGQPDEEHERVTPPGRRTIIYPAANGPGHKQAPIEIPSELAPE